MIAILCSVSTDSTFTGKSGRSRAALQQATRLIGKSTQPRYQDNFDNSAVKLVNVLETTFSKSTEYTRSRAVQSEKIWQAFHVVRISKLVNLWEQLIKSLEEDLDPLVQQYVNQKLYEDIKSKCCSHPSTMSIHTLTPDEENIIRYASGYVPMVLMKRHERNVSEKSASFVECLSCMAVNGEESTILEYTSQWVSKVNRGGLFEVNDMGYLLFREIEINLRDKLTKLLQPSTTVQLLDRKEEFITSAIQDNNIQFYWTMLSVDIDSEQESVELLKEIVELWLTIRGFSITGQWMEIYKYSAKTTKKSKSLRKTLKQGTNE